MKVASLFAALSLKPEKKGFLTADRLIGGLKVALVGLVGFKTVGWFKNLFTSVADTADQFNKMSHQVGISSESLQGLEFAAELSGTSIDTIRNSLQRFSRSADSANRGSKQSVDSFKELGVAFKDSNGKLRNVEEMFLDAAEAIAAMPNGTEKTAKAMILFGRSGARMLPMLNAGRAGIEAMKKEFVELGGQIDQKTGAQFEQLNDDMLRVKTVVQGVKNQIAIALMPVVQDVTTNVLNWAKANRELITTKVRAFIEGAVSAARSAWAVFVEWWAITKEVAGAIAEMVNSLVDLVGGWGVVKDAFFGMIDVTKTTLDWVRKLNFSMLDLLSTTLEYLGIRVNLFKEGENAGVPRSTSPDFQRIRQEAHEAAARTPEFFYGGRGRPATPTRSHARRQASNIDARATMNITVNPSEAVDEEAAARVIRREAKKVFDEQVREIDAIILPEGLRGD